jgi:TPR repeat protein
MFRHRPGNALVNGANGQWGSGIINSNRNILQTKGWVGYAYFYTMRVKKGEKMKKVMIVVVVAMLALGFGTSLVGDTKVVRMPRFSNMAVGNEVQAEELIDLDTQDMFTKQSFAQLMQEKHADDLPYIVARVVTRGPEGDSVDYCNAHDLHKLFGGYPLKNSKPSYSYKAPYNGFPIQQVDYFMIKNPDDATFSYICSYYDVMIDPAKRAELSELFHVNQTENADLHVKALLRLLKSEAVDPVLLTMLKMRLGEIYYWGRYGVAKNYNRASEYLDDLVDDENVNPALLARVHGILGEIYYSGEYGAEKNYAKACRSIEWLLARQADARTMVPMQLRLAHMLYVGGYGLTSDYPRALGYFEQIADQHDDDISSIRAEYRLGQMYYRGQGVAKNYERASYYLDCVARQKIMAALSADALLMLGEIYYFGGNGVPQNYRKASHYYAQAALQENDPAVAARANYWLAEMHYFGQVGNTVSYADAHDLWQEAANQRDNPAVAARAKYWLGTLYYEGKGVEKNNRFAKRYLKEAAEQEFDRWASVEARSWIAWLHYQGDVVSHDYKQAAQHWEYVADQQDNPDACVDAMLGLGEIYYVGGYGVSRDLNKSRTYFERVVATQDPDSEQAVKAKEWLSEFEKMVASKS